MQTDAARMDAKFARDREAAMRRELDEEVGVKLTAAPELHGIFSNFASFPGDHIAVFVVRHWTRNEGYRKLGEIAEARMFAQGELPERIDAGTRARLAEIFDGAGRRDFHEAAQATGAALTRTLGPGVGGYSRSRGLSTARGPRLSTWV